MKSPKIEKKVRVNVPLRKKIATKLNERLLNKPDKSEQKKNKKCNHPIVPVLQTSRQMLLFG